MAKATGKRMGAVGGLVSRSQEELNESRSGMSRQEVADGKTQATADMVELARVVGECIGHVATLHHLHAANETEALAQETKTAAIDAKDEEIIKLEKTVETMECQMEKLNEDHLALVRFSLIHGSPWPYTKLYSS